MSETTKTPRAHAEMAARFMADSSLKCWAWAVDARRWVENERPRWYENLVYHVGHKKPTAPPKRRVTMAGITFNAQESVAPEPKTRYYVPQPIAMVNTSHINYWTNSQFDRHLLERGVVHLDREDAKLHAEALIILSKELKWHPI